MSQENSEFQPSPPPPIQPQNNSLNYMLFAFGAILLVTGIYLCTYTTVQIVNTPMNIPGLGSYDIPHAEQVQPYVSFGIFAIIASFGLIIFALFGMRGKITDYYK